MKAHWQYLKYVLRHKWYVFQECMKLGVPIWRAIIHDWDKFLPDEWFAYVGTFYDKEGNKIYNETTEFAVAWNKHQKRNRHHYQFWMLTWDRGETVCLPMPDSDRREMLADWYGAGRAIMGRPGTTLDWYAKNKENIKLHPETRSWVEQQLAGI